MNTPTFDPGAIRAIVTDLDDTLVDEAGRLTPYTVDVLHRCIARGIHVIPASGRTHTSLAPYAEKIGVDCPYIACNGSQLISPDHQLLEETALSPELAREIYRYLQERDIYVQVYRGEYFYYARECAPSQKYQHISGMKGQAVGDLLAFIDYPVTKVLAITDPEIVRQITPEIRKRFSGQAEFSTSKPFFFETVPCGVSKGNVLRRLSAQLGLTPENTLVFGDSLNDISMIQFSRHSVAMGNAREEVKAAAAYVCAPNTEDGVARFLEEYLLKPLEKEELS